MRSSTGRMGRYLIMTASSYTALVVILACLDTWGGPVACGPASTLWGFPVCAGACGAVIALENVSWAFWKILAASVLISSGLADAVYMTAGILRPGLPEALLTLAVSAAVCAATGTVVHGMDRQDAEEINEEIRERRAADEPDH